MGDVNACTTSLQLDIQEAIMPFLSKDLSETLMYNRISMDTKEPSMYGKALLCMCNSTSMVIGNGIPIWKDPGEYTCRRHNGDKVTGYILLSKTEMHNVQNFTLGNQNSKSNNRKLCIDIN